MSRFDESKIDILFVMGDIDRQILEDIREALGSIREQIGLIDARLAQLADGLAEGGIVNEAGDEGDGVKREEMPVQEALETLMQEPSPESPAATSPAEERRDPARFAWRTDRPGTPVRNIFSAISLNDRLLYIRDLFAGDPVLFQKTISVFNSISSLAEAEAYIRSHFPEWKMDSDTVYRFMMAVRRRLS